MIDELMDKATAERWDNYVIDKPELKEIIGKLAQAILFLKLQLDKVEVK